jgi:hypothetical protein
MTSARVVPSRGKGTAMVAIARTLLVVVWQVLTHQVADRHADLPMGTRKVQRWGRQVPRTRQSARPEQWSLRPPAPRAPAVGSLP